MLMVRQRELLADTSVNLVLAQIKTATAGTNASADVAWASQPGMIRTYDTKGKMLRAYKLYSSRSWVLTNAVDAAAEAAALVNWKDKPAHYTDLNAPVSSQYPILDPARRESSRVFPSPRCRPASPKEKCRSSGCMSLRMAPSSRRRPPPRPPAIATVPGASDTNPITGRIAFWTDDETAKVNVNTASEGTFWDTPRVITEYDRRLGKYQPVKNEFQRYPGHPAMVSLQTALPTIATPARAYSVSPRYADGGSKQGTVSNLTTPVKLKYDRLYASVDELAFDPDRNRKGYPGGARPEPVFHYDGEPGSGGEYVQTSAGGDVADPQPDLERIPHGGGPDDRFWRHHQ